MTQETAFQLKPYGPRAFLIEGGSSAQRSYLAEVFERQAGDAFVEWVMGYESLLLRFNRAVEADEILSRLRRIGERAELEAANAGEGSLHEIPVRYDGPDLEDLARHADLSIDEVIEKHSAASYEVRFLGFSPGFAYLDGLDEALHCPRRSTPRKRLDAGAVAIGGAHAGIYPLASPGGWNWIGSTDYPLFRSDGGESPFALGVGDQVSFLPQ